MPVTIYPTNLKYKNSNGQFQSATAIKGDSGEGIVVQVSGTTPTIVCEDNHRYICGEVLSLNITPPANGVCEIIFESGSTATLLTAPNTIKWPEWFNPNSLETSATYQFKISNGLANVAIWPDEGLTGDTRVRIQKMLGIYQPPFELVNDITLTEESSINLTADSNGTPYNFRSVFIVIDYPANTQTASSGYGRYEFFDLQNKSVYAETLKYTTQAYASYKYIYVTRVANLTMVNYTTRVTTGDTGTWHCKSFPYGSAVGLGNIVQIITRNVDPEPADTRIRIYAQWAY